MNPFQLTPTEEKNWQLIEQYYEAWRKKNFDNVKFASDFHYDGPGGQHFNNSTDFMASVSSLARFVNVEILIKKKFIDGDLIGVFYDFITDVPVIGTLATAGLYQLSNGQIQRITNYFDPGGIITFREQMAKQRHQS